MSTLPSTCNMPVTSLTTWGSTGTDDGQFDRLLDVDVDRSDSIYVVDGDNQRIQKFDSNGTFLTKWGSVGGGDGQFAFSDGGVTVDSAGNVCVADAGNHRVQKSGQTALTLTKAVDDREPALGQQITFFITVKNDGFVGATDALISDTLPVSITFAGPVTLDPAQPNAILATSALSLPTLASNVTITTQTSLTLTLPVTVNLDTSTTLVTNAAAVTSAEISTPVTGQVSFGGKHVYLPIVLKDQ